MPYEAQLYLLVFITLVISLIGLYAQVLTLQIARMAAQQTTIAEAMKTWHSTARAQARNAVCYLGPYTPSATGCDLTDPNSAPYYLPACPMITTALYWGYADVTTTNVFASSNVPDCGGGTSSPTSPCWTSLPPGYNGAMAPIGYRFQSIYYQPAGSPQSYVLTFVPPPVTSSSNPPPGFIDLPHSGPYTLEISLTMSDLLGQIRNTGLSPFFYGTVQNGQLITSAIGVASSNVTYPVPPAVPNGSIGIISAP